MADQYTIAVNLMDESFQPGDTRNYGLAVILDESSVNCCTLDLKRNKFLGLHHFINPGARPQLGQADARLSFRDFLNAVFTDIPWLKNGFKTIKIAFNGKKSTLVPAMLFNPVEKEQYFRFNFRQEDDELIFCDHLMPLDAWNVFTVPGPVMEATQEFFPKSRVIHASSLMIESVWVNYKNRTTAPHIFLHVREQVFDLMIFDGRQMTYFNTFSFLNPEEVTYYLIFVLEQLGFNPETIPLVLLGNVAAGDGLFMLLHQYIRHIETGRRNEAYRYSYVLNQLPPQSFFPLLNFFSCGL
jgi:hypothetical protein